MSGNDWTDAWVPAFDAYVDELHNAAFGLMMSYAPQIEAEMKANAPWTDHTGNARQSLWAKATKTEDGAEVTFGHGMNYGIFLELAHQSRFSIVLPTSDRFSVRVMDDIRRVIKE